MPTIPHEAPRLETLSAPSSADDSLPFEPHEIEHSIGVRLGRIVDRFRDRLAVKDETRALTFGELGELSDRVASAVQTSGAQLHAPVVLLMNSGAALVAALCGILKAGRVLVPVDPTHPVERIREMVSDARASVFVADSEHLNLARRLGGSNRAVIHFEEVVVGEVAVDTACAVRPEDPAVLFYTSGSVGTPKGVLHSHGSLMHLSWRISHRIGLSARDRAALLHSLATVSATGIILRTLLNGAAVLPFDVKNNGLAALAFWLNDHRISVLQIVPTLFRHLMRTSGDQMFPEVRVLWLGGETVIPRDVALFRNHFGPRCVFINNLGTTETGSFLQYHVTRDSEIAGGTLPVGFPYNDPAVSILDGRGRELGSGAIGEIAVKSRFLAVGYWRQPELTEQRFRTCPGTEGERVYLTGDLGRLRADGAIEHLGRKDGQIKVRGFRVEVSEVESRLLDLPEVSEAAVVASGNTPSENQLVAHVVTSGGDTPSPKLLRRHLAAALPDHMVPALFVFRNALPRLPGGKLDRQKLAQRRHEEPVSSYSAKVPSDPITLELTRIWEEVIGFAPIAPGDNFFDVGGHSLLAARMLDRVEEVFVRRLPLTVLLEAPTIKQLAHVLRDPPTTECPTLIPLRGQGNRPPLFLIPPAHGTVLNLVTLVRHLGDDQPVYGLQPRGFDGAEPPHETVEEMAIHYLAAIREKYPAGPYYLAGRCFGGVVAFEMAQRILASDEQVGLLAAVDTVRAPGWALRDGPAKPRRSPLLAPWHHLVAICKRSRVGKALGRTTRAAFPQASEQSVAAARKPAHSTAHAVMQLKRAHRRAHRLYVPSVYPGHLVVFETSKSSRKERAWQAKWAALAAQGLTRHILQGDHFTITREPLVIEVARRLRAEIDRAVGRC